MLTVLSNLVVMFSEEEAVCMVGYSIFFVCIDWLLYNVLLFAMEYTGYRGRNRIGLRVLYLLLWIDSASMLSNNIFHHAFTCMPVVTSGGELYYRLDSYTFYTLHLFLAYATVFMSLVFLLIKIVMAPALYRRKYAIVFGILSVTVILDGVYVFLRQVVDISIVFFAVSGILIYYYAVQYEPKDLLKSMLALVVKGMDNAVVLFDAEGECIHVNESAEQLLGVREEEEEKLKRLWEQWNTTGRLAEYGEHGWDEDVTQGDSELHLHFEYRKMKDKNGNFMGSFFVIHDHTKEVENLAKEHYLATHDRMTGLYNKEYFYEKAAERLCENPYEQLIMVCSDVQNFKMINDVFGTRMGDELLGRIGQAIREQTYPGEIYGRLESDRFALLMRKEDYREQIFVKQPQDVVQIDSDICYPINVYIGVYEINDRTIPVSVMCDRAIMAIRTIKGSYDKHVAYYDEALRNEMLQEQELAGSLEGAIADGQFRLYLQPQTTADGQAMGAEALVRWQHPQKGLLMPGEFIEALEKNGMIVKLDQHVWELACMQLRKWKQQGNTQMYLSVNISPRDFYFLDIYRVFTELVEKYEIEPRNLKLEITETAVIMNLERQIELIEKLRKSGFVIEMDDFGSGYSSLNMLKNIQVDILKIDMAFLGRTSDEERGRKILKMVIELSKELGMPVITEGVETKEQVDCLTEIGCEMFQGYYFAKPMPIAEFEEKYMQKDAAKSIA
jgi:diguanylate cyclase (GGDEF)-like protein